MIHATFAIGFLAACLGASHVRERNESLLVDCFFRADDDDRRALGGQDV